jgi:hypothetical protein
MGGRPVLIVFDATGDTAIAFDRTVDGRTLDFQLRQSSTGLPVLTDAETGSQWETLTGQATGGTFQGASLQQLPANYSFWFAWTDFYPETGLYESSGEAPGGL